MANKTKEIIPNRLSEIRAELGYTQKQMGEILKVSAEMVQRYEHEESNLPIENAILLSQKLNYSLDWIYDNDFVSFENEESHFNFRKKFDLINYSQEECNSFLVDIRDYLKISDDCIKFAVNNSYWEYMKNINKINNENITKNEKTIRKKQLNAEYYIDDFSNIVWEVSIPHEDFVSMLTFYNKSFPFANDDHKLNPTTEQIKEFEDFILMLDSNNHNEE